MVRLIAMKGATDTEIEDIFLVPKGSLAKWRKLYPSFAEALDKGRSVPDGDVLYALYKNAVGYDYTEEQAVGGKVPSVMSVQRHRPAEFAAQKYWLGNRTTWRSTESVEHSGRDGGPIGVKQETRNDIIDGLLKLIQPKVDKEEAPKKDKPK